MFLQKWETTFWPSLESVRQGGQVPVRGGSPRRNYCCTKVMMKTMHHTPRAWPWCCLRQHKGHSLDGWHTDQEFSRPPSRPRNGISRCYQLLCPNKWQQWWCKKKEFYTRLSTIIQIRWPDTISNRELWEMDQTNSQQSMKSSRGAGYVWDTHTKVNDLYHRSSPDLEPTGKEKGRSRNTWRRDMEG